MFLATLPQKVQQAIICFCESRGWYIQSYMDDKIVAASFNKFTKGDLDTLQNDVLELGPLSKCCLPPSPKMTSKCRCEAEMRERTRLLSEAFGSEVSVGSSGIDVVEIMPLGVSKLTTLQKLCACYGILMEETVSCGDSGNDYEMITHSGLGCCMANGVPELKKAAGYVCQKEYSYGVLEVIERFFV